MGRTTGSLALAIGLLVLSVVIGLYTDVRSSEITRHRDAIESRLQRVQTLNEAIHAALVDALLQENIVRAAQYNVFNEELDMILTDVRHLSDFLLLSSESEHLAQEKNVLQSLQNEAYSLMLRDNWPEALQILANDSYLRNRKLYEINSDLAIVALSSELANKSRIYEQQRFGALWLILVAVLLLLWVGRRYSVRLKQEAQKQADLRETIARANQDLEHKVQLRTAELQTANERLERLSSLDGLSGLANRRTFDQTLLTEWQRAQRHGQWLAVIMLDIDNFKAYNDHYGHQAGDACIQALAQVLSDSVRRSGELVARYGGEEFVFLLPGSDVSAALKTAERTRQAVEARALPHAYSATADHVTISLGVAALRPGPDDISARLVKMADDALYAAKNAGRNRVHSYFELSEEPVGV